MSNPTEVFTCTDDMDRSSAVPAPSRDLEAEAHAVLSGAQRLLDAMREVRS